MNPYDHLAHAIAAEADPEDLVFVDCDCKRGEPYVLGGEPEYFTKFREAALSWASHAVYKRLYWGVHYRWWHVIHVRNRYGLACLEHPNPDFEPGEEKE